MGRLRDILVLFLLVLPEFIHLSGTDNYRSADTGDVRRYLTCPHPEQ